MTLIVLSAAALAALLHVYIFRLESFRWQDDRTRKIFGTTVEQAATTRQLAYNQGFYNLFLAIVTGVGIVALALGHTGVGTALILAGIGSMAAAALVLMASARDKLRAAVVQGTLPVIGIILLLIGLRG